MRIFAMVSVLAWTFLGCDSPPTPLKSGPGEKAASTNPSGENGASGDAKGQEQDAANDGGPVSNEVTESVKNGEKSEVTVPKETPATCATADLALKAGGQDRHSSVFAPEGGLSDGKAIILFHGNGDDRQNFCRSLGICDFFRKKGYIVAVPDGRLRDVRVAVSNQTLNGIAWDGYNFEASNNEDLALFDGLVTALKSNCSASKFFILGHSQGGFLSALLLMQRAQALTGVAISAAGESVPGYRWQPARKVPFAITIGTRDFSFSNAQSFHDRLKADGYQAKFTPIDGLAHGPFPRGAEQGFADFFATIP